jgi:hypothetical protein
MKPPPPVPLVVLAVLELVVEVVLVVVEVVLDVVEVVLVVADVVELVVAPPAPPVPASLDVVAALPPPPVPVVELAAQPAACASANAAAKTPISARWRAAQRRRGKPRSVISITPRARAPEHGGSPHHTAFSAADPRAPRARSWHVPRSCAPPSKRSSPRSSRDTAPRGTST